MAGNHAGSSGKDEAVPTLNMVAQEEFDERLSAALGDDPTTMRRRR